MADAFTSLIQGLSAHLRVQLEIEDGRTVRADFDGLPLLLEHLPEAEQILLAVPIANLPPEGREEIFRELLKAQYLFTETRGAALALDPDEEFVCLQIAPSMRALTPGNFPALMENFLNVAEAWRRRLEGIPAAPAGGNSQGQPDEADAPGLPPIMAGFERA